MTIDEAIEELKSENGYYATNGMTDVAEFNTKIIRLLEELKVYHQHEVICNKGYNAGYNKGINDFVDKFISLCDDGEFMSKLNEFSATTVLEIAEQLKDKNKQ